MKLGGVVVILAVGLVWAASASAASGVIRPPRVQGTSSSTSTNWAGAAATGGTYHGVSATWTQPTASCTSATSYSSFWAGLDGNSSSTVEQIGTEADCSQGQPTYYAWYEMYPKLGIRLDLNIQPGDTITASVSTDGNGLFTLTLTDGAQSFSTTLKAHHTALSSAEVIAEAPSSSHGPFGTLALTNFDKVTFSNVNVTDAAGNTEPIRDSNPDLIQMVEPDGTTPKATTRLKGQSSVTVAWDNP